MSDKEEKEKGFWDFMDDRKFGNSFKYLFYAILAIALIIWQIIANN